MSDTIAKLRELLLHRSKAGMLRGLLDQEQRESVPTWNGMLGGLTGASELPYKDVEMTPERIRNGLSGLVDMMPVVGDIKSGIEGVQAAREGDWAGAGLGMLGALPMVPNLGGVIKPKWWDEPSSNAFAKGMTEGETILDWMARHKVPQEGDKYVFYHGTPKGGDVTDHLRAGSLLETDAKEAAKFAASNKRGMKPKDMEVIKVAVDPWEISTGTWASLRDKYKIK